MNTEEIQTSKYDCPKCGDDNCEVEPLKREEFKTGQIGDYYGTEWEETVKCQNCGTIYKFWNSDI